MRGSPLYWGIRETGLKRWRPPPRSTTIKTLKKEVDFISLVLIFKNIMSKTNNFKIFRKKKTMKMFAMLRGTGTKYSRMEQLLSRPYYFKFLKGCLPQISLGPFLNALTPF